MSIRTEGEGPPKEPNRTLYREILAYTPETLGYRFEVVYRDPDFQDPTIDELVNGFNGRPTLAIAQTEPDQKTKHPRDGTLTIISPAHNRSSAANRIGYSDFKTGDERYKALSLKGNAVPEEMVKADIRFDPATGIRISGLWLGTNHASFYLKYAEKCREIASAGLPSERIVAIFTATHVPFSSTEVGTSTEHKGHEFNQQLRQKLIDHFLGNSTTLSNIKYQQSRTWGGDSTMLKYRIKNLLSSGEIAIILRAMQVNERIRDISFSATKSELDKLTQPARDFVSAQDLEDYQFLHVSTDMKTEEFLQTWLPQQMGFHLGCWHKKGFVHGYAHDQNWTLAGTLIDIDSARQRSDYDLSNQDQLHQYRGMQLYDLLRSFTSVNEIFGALFKDIPLEGRDQFLQIRDRALVNFLVEYAKVMFPLFDTLSQKIEAVVAFVKQKLPNPHFDAARDDSNRQTISITQPTEEYDPDLWERTLKSLQSAAQ